VVTFDENLTNFQSIVKFFLNIRDIIKYLRPLLQLVHTFELFVEQLVVLVPFYVSDKVVEKGFIDHFLLV